MLRILLSTLLLTIGAAAQTPQPTAPPTQPPAPVERRAPPAPSGIYAWPTSQNLKPGTSLLLTTTARNAPPYACRLGSLDADHIACRNPHHAAPTVFDRVSVAMIEGVDTPHLHLPYGYFAASGALFVIGLGCTVLTGSGPCAVLAATGLIGALVGFYVNLISSVRDIHHSPYPFTLYIAPPPAPLAP